MSKKARSSAESGAALARAFAEAHDVPCGGISMAATGGSLIGVFRCARFETGFNLDPALFVRIHVLVAFFS
jgi:hypothetical protein